MFKTNVYTLLSRKFLTVLDIIIRKVEAVRFSLKFRLKMLHFPKVLSCLGLIK